MVHLTYSLIKRLYFLACFIETFQKAFNSMVKMAYQASSAVYISLLHKTLRGKKYILKSINHVKLKPPYNDRNSFMLRLNGKNIN